MLINFQNQSDSKNLKFLFDGIFFLIPETETIFIYLNKFKFDHFLFKFGFTKKKYLLLLKINFPAISNFTQAPFYEKIFKTRTYL